MPIKYVEGDLFEPLLQDKDPGMIVLPHIVNTFGKWGKGFVIPLGKKFPAAKELYLSESNNCILGFGKCQFISVGTDERPITVVNMVAQTLGGSRPLYYNYLSECMDRVAKFVLNTSKDDGYAAKIVAPMFGAGLAGGDFNIIEALIEDCWVRKGISVTIHYLKNDLPDNWSPPNG